MTLQEIYEKAVEVGKANDWRGEDCIEQVLAMARAEASESGFDPDRLFNPYGDTRIIFGDPDTPVESILVGIEIWPKEVLLAGAMRNAGKREDLCISHHTTCVNRGFFCFDDILLTHKYSLAEAGVPRDKYDPLVDQWISNPGREWKLDTINAAKNLDIPLLVIHTPCDLIHVKRTREVFGSMKDRSLAEIATELNDIEEFARHPYLDVVVHGDADAKPGTVYNPIGAGWQPKLEVFELACEAGIDTALLVAPQPEHFAMAADHGVNVVHIPSDPNCTYGINVMLDELERCGVLTIYEAENFVRVRRV